MSHQLFGTPGAPEGIESGIEQVLSTDQVANLLRDGNGVDPMTENEKQQFSKKVRTLLEKGFKVQIQATWAERGEDVNQTVVDKVYRKKAKNSDEFDIWALWEDGPDNEYEFPHPLIDYFALSIVKIYKAMPGGQPRDEQLAALEGMQVRDPPKFSSFVPLTWAAWIDSLDEFKPRELVRELRETPELGVRFNPPAHRERLFAILVKWIYAARVMEGWKDEQFICIAEMLIEELRNHYWAAAGAPVERVQQRLHKDDDPQDRYGQIMTEEQLRVNRLPRVVKGARVCYNCRQTGHVRAQCPRLQSGAPQPVFRGGVASGAQTGVRRTQ